jgi:hypothetical protein
MFDPGHRLKVVAGLCSCGQFKSGPAGCQPDLRRRHVTGAVPGVQVEIVE